MPVIHTPIDKSTLVMTSIVMSIITSIFLATMGIKLGIAIIVGVVVGIILYQLGIIPIGILAIIGIAMVIAVLKMMFGKNESSSD